MTQMTNYQLKNSTDKPVKVHVSKDGHKEEYILAPGELRTMPKLAGATLSLPVATDLTLRQKKASTSKFTRVAKIVKETLDKVYSIVLPEVFTILKIKNVHEA